MSFPTTHWSLIAEASLSGDAGARAALARLCQLYHPPAVAFLIRRGYPADTAEDHGRSFFLSLLESSAWKRADRARGRFRTFLLGTLLHIVGRSKTRNEAECRGGGAFVASLDELAEKGLEASPAVG